MTENELFLYKLISALSQLNAPIVFKGAIVLKQLMYTSGNKSNLGRSTQDLDGDWIDNPPSMEYLEQLINQAVIMTGYNLKVVKTRDYGENKSACFKFIRDNKVFSSMI